MWNVQWLNVDEWLDLEDLSKTNMIPTSMKPETTKANSLEGLLCIGSK